MACLDQVIRLDVVRYARARIALARAFFDYNLMVYAAPNARHRAPAVASLYGAILSDCFRLGEVYVTADGVGTACWLPPAMPASTFVREVRAGMLAVPLRFGWGGFRRLMAYHATAQRLHHVHAPMSHWYLSAIGVEPEQQGKGVGSALMQPILERADADGIHCYLETHRESNVRVYERNGFAVAEQSEVPKHPIPIWAMLRKPR